MAVISKPNKTTQWATDAGALVTEPNAGQKTGGWGVKQKVPAHFLNWWKNLVYQWITWITARVDGSWINVLEYGAVGDGVTDDTAAIQAAITAAKITADMTGGTFTTPNWRSGCVVYFPPGIYRTTGNITVDFGGITLRGAGPKSSIIYADYNAPGTDALTFSAGAVGRYGGGIQGLAINAKVAGNIRDALHIDNWSQIDLKDVWTYGGSRYGIFLGAVVLGTLHNVQVQGSALAGLWVGLGSVYVDVCTALSATNLHVLGVTNGPGVRCSAVYGFTFNGLTVEGIAAAADDDAAGIIIETGSTVTLNGPYFEHNQGWDIWVGKGVAGVASATITNPRFVSDVGKAVGYGCLKVDRVLSGMATGGFMLIASAVSVAITANAQNFSILGLQIPAGAPPTFNGGDINGYPGLVTYVDSDGRTNLGGSFIPRMYLGGRLVSTAGGPPGTGTWSVGDLAFNNVVQQNVPFMWRCTTAGSPGVWTPMYPQIQKLDRFWLAYSPAITPNVDNGHTGLIIVTDGVAFTINAPAGTPIRGQRLTIEVYNNSGGAAGALTWNGIYRLSAWVQPANGSRRAITFEWDTGNWREVSRTPADVPN